LLEYTWLGLFASLTGVILSVAGGWALCTFFLEVKFAPDYLSLGVMTLLLTGITVLIGWWNSRSVMDAPPLTVLRREN
jgi:putative ABC transport system permease protein